MRKLLAITLLTMALLAACSSKDTSFKYSDLPAGDATHGAALFAESVNGSVACSNCHTVNGADGAGPTLENFASTAAGRVKGQSAQEYAFYSILRPSKYLRVGLLERHAHRLRGQVIETRHRRSDRLRDRPGRQRREHDRGIIWRGR